MLKLVRDLKSTFSSGTRNKSVSLFNDITKHSPE